MEEFSRIERIIGNEKLDLIKGLNVLIVGIGGVGGITLEMLVRSGISNITIIDYDTFEESNLNRQILCLRSNINKSKVLVAKKRVLDINPYSNINIIQDKLTACLLDKINSSFDYIIDACDDVKAKVELVKYAIKNNIKIISCCGTGNRVKPEELIITNIWKTKNDPLARKLRYYLKKEQINYKLPVVCSKEIPLIKTNKCIGSLAIVTNAAGILLASYVINDTLNSI